jgi:hypothetical protein
MADISRHSPGMAGHPDAAEMRERYARMTEGRRVEMIEGLVMLTGLYTAISPWVVHFHGTRSNLAISNLVLGLAIALIGLGLAMLPDRGAGLSWMLVPIGIWLIISPWVATAQHGSPKGVIWNNVVVGVITCLLGAATAAMAMMRRRPRRGTERTATMPR